jgi:hypothetical protein
VRPSAGPLYDGVRRLGACCKTVPPPAPEAGASWESVPQRTRMGAPMPAPPVPSLRIVSGPRTSSAYVFAAALEAVHQAIPPPVVASALAPADAPAAPAGAVGLRLNLGGAALGQTEDRQRADSKGTEPPQNSSPRGRGCHPLRYLVEPSRVHVDLPHGLRLTPTDLAGSERCGTASGRPGEPRPPIAG